jgi:hypothetical protein
MLPGFYSAKRIFLVVNASLRWLNNVSGMYLVQISLLLIGQQGLGNFLEYRGLLPIGWRAVQIVRQHRRKMKSKAPTTRSAIQAASKFTFMILSMHSYTPLVIRGCRNEKN